MPEPISRLKRFDLWLADHTGLVTIAYIAGWCLLYWASRSAPSPQ